ncbi:hypothetical protein FOE78_14475 [Microlunatus elymi]|uniref:Uncharacterized protein n=1 Tax=Microlunatus elymi TaxID=2596828 RepID=A0A516Q0K3_9ACTN|nr:hypothetical protein [Microlunatus elymi]QDP96963.1 hypothetical protein FOE78_14475 [Microlunatus elymi]
MRTTLDLDERVLAAARALAAAKNISVGRALSELALRGLAGPASENKTRSGFPVISGVSGHVITDEMVESALEEE